MLLDYTNGLMNRIIVIVSAAKNPPRYGGAILRCAHNDNSGFFGSLLEPFCFKLTHFGVIASDPLRQRPRGESVAIQSPTQRPEFVAPLPAVAFWRRLGGLPRRFAPRNDNEMVSIQPKQDSLLGNLFAGITQFIEARQHAADFLIAGAEFDDPLTYFPVEIIQIFRSVINLAPGDFQHNILEQVMAGAQ